MFMLLLFFLLTSSFLKPSIHLNLPEASNTEKVNKEDIIISIDKNSNIFLNRNKVDADMLEDLLRKKLHDSKKKNIIFQGDENILYKKFIKVMDIIKSSGAKGIDIAHEKNI